MEQPLVSAIVPTRNSAGTIAACLRSIREQSYLEVEIIVVDNGSNDGTDDMAREYADRVLDHGPERSAQRNYGVEMSSGSYVLILDSDMEPARDVVKSCVAEALSDPAIKAVVVPEESFGTGFWAKCKNLERSYYVGIDWMEAARFFEKAAFEEMEGYDLENTGTEDFDLPQRIKAKYGTGSISRVGDLIYHNEQDLKLLDSLKKKYYYGKKLDAYRARDENVESLQKQVNVLKRFALFFSQPRKLFADPLVGLGMLFMKVCDYGAWASGYIASKLARTGA